MVEFALKVTIVIFITEVIIAPVKIFTEAAASVASTVATALKVQPKCQRPLQLLSPPFLTTRTTKHVAKRKGGGEMS